MKLPSLLAVALVAIASACAPVEPKFPPGAKLHGPYLDRSFEGYIVNAAFEKDITIISVQDAEKAPEATPEQLQEARLLLGDGSVIGPRSLAGISRKAAAFEDVAVRVSQVPGWCRGGTTFSYLPPIPTELTYKFKIRGSYHGDIGAFVFAGQCR